MTLTVLQEKLAEAHGLAIAATAVTVQVEAIVMDAELHDDLRALRDDAEETRTRCLDVEPVFGVAQAETMLAHANTTHAKASDLAGAWFMAGTDAVAAWSFLAMGVAAEVTVWTAVATLARKTAHGEVCELADWAVDLQRRHLEQALAGAIRLAAQLDPVAPRYG